MAWIRAKGNHEMSLLIRPIALLVLAVGFVASAAACNLEQLQKQVGTTPYDTILKELRGPNCLGDPTVDGQNALVKRINELTPAQDEKDVVGRFEAVRAALQALTAYATERALVGVQVESWRALSLELKESDRQLGGIDAKTSEQDALNIEDKALSNKWGRVQESDNGAIALDGIQVELLQRTGCATTQPCPAFESQRDLIRVSYLVFRVRGYAERVSLARHYADAQLQSARWDAYRSQGQHQYFWEVWINGQRMSDADCPRDTATGIRRGFCSVPTSQLIVLHPDVGLRWSNVQSASDLQAAFIVEALGYYHWKWDPKEPSTMTSQWGVSIAAAYSEVGSGKKWSYGPMFHIGNGYNLAATRSPDGKWGVLLNLNLANRYFAGKQYVDSFKKGEIPSFSKLLSQ
jgi:hypothetical protein